MEPTLSALNCPCDAEPFILAAKIYDVSGLTAHGTGPAAPEGGLKSSYVPTLAPLKTCYMVLLLGLCTILMICVSTIGSNSADQATYSSIWFNHKPGHPNIAILDRLQSILNQGRSIISLT